MNGLKRGNVLWESSRMFLPEHKEQLLKRKKQQQEYKIPELGEDKLKEINESIMESICFDQALTIFYAAEYGEATFFGKVVKVNHLERWLKVKNDRETIALSFETIIDVG
ncbi:YolD-like family protein [bacterium LRH843]|nr:YolD-like family protein [bacterium LRH843]